MDSRQNILDSKLLVSFNIEVLIIFSLAKMIKLFLFLITSYNSGPTDRQKATTREWLKKLQEKRKAEARQKFDEGPKMYWTIKDYRESPSCAERQRIDHYVIKFKRNTIYQSLQ